MANMNAEAIEFEIERLQECCAQYRDDIKTLTTENRRYKAMLKIERNLVDRCEELEEALQAITSVEQDSPAALRAVLLIAEEALASAQVGQK